MTTDGAFLVGDGTADPVVEASSVALNSITPSSSDGDFLVSDGTNWIAESGATVRTSLALGSTDTPTFLGVNLGNENMDHYDEGSWTPVLTFVNPGDLSVVYVNQVGRYVRIGNLVFAGFFIATSTFTHTTATGPCQITGLPFTVSNITAVPWRIGMAGWRGITKPNFTDMMNNPARNTALMSFSISGSAQTPATITELDMPSAGTVNLTGIAIFTVGLS